MLLAFSKYNERIGYVQGMNFLAASLLYHCDEVISFWLLVALTEERGLSQVYSPGLSGLHTHLERFTQVLSHTDPEIYKVLMTNFEIPILEIAFQNWVFTLFSSEIPLSKYHLFLS